MVTGRVLLHSGGLDSHMAWLLAGKPTPVYVRIGAKYQLNELQALGRLQAHDPTFRVLLVDGPQVGQLEDPVTGHIPHRNLALLTAAATVADTVLYGVVAGEASPDKSRAFVRHTSRVLSSSAGRPVRVVTPLRRYTKTQALRRTLQAFPWRHTREALALTISCYAVDAPCGSCQSCFRRAVAEYANGLRSTPPAWPTQHQPVLDALRKAPVREWPAMARNNAHAWWLLRGRP